MERRLSNKQTLFVRAVQKGMNYTQAAEEAGYSKPRMAGSRLMTNADIRKAIDRLAKKSEKMHIATVEQRKEILTNIMLDPKANATDRCKALDLLNKMDAIYVRKVEMSAQVKMTPEQLEEKAIEVYRQNPEMWERIKEGVEGAGDQGDDQGVHEDEAVSVE